MKTAFLFPIVIGSLSIPSLIADNTTNNCSDYIGANETASYFGDFRFAGIDVLSNEKSAEIGLNGMHALVASRIPGNLYLIHLESGNKTQFSNFNESFTMTAIYGNEYVLASFGSTLFSGAAQINIYNASTGDFVSTCIPSKGQALVDGTVVNGVAYFVDAFVPFLWKVDLMEDVAKDSCTVQGLPLIHEAFNNAPDGSYTTMATAIAPYNDGLFICHERDQAVFYYDFKSENITEVVSSWSIGQPSGCTTATDDSGTKLYVVQYPDDCISVFDIKEGEFGPVATYLGYIKAPFLKSPTAASIDGDLIYVVTSGIFEPAFPVGNEDGASISDKSSQSTGQHPSIESTSSLIDALDRNMYTCADNTASNDVGLSSNPPSPDTATAASRSMNMPWIIMAAVGVLSELVLRLM